MYIDLQYMPYYTLGMFSKYSRCVHVLITVDQVYMITKVGHFLFHSKSMSILYVFTQSYPLSLN